MWFPFYYLTPEHVLELLLLLPLSSSTPLSTPNQWRNCNNKLHSWDINHSCSTAAKWSPPLLWITLDRRRLWSWLKVRARLMKAGGHIPAIWTALQTFVRYSLSPATTQQHNIIHCSWIFISNMRCSIFQRFSRGPFRRKPLSKCSSRSIDW